MRPSDRNPNGDDGPGGNPGGGPGGGTTPDDAPPLEPGDCASGGGIIGNWRERILRPEGGIDWKEWEYVARHYHEPDVQGGQPRRAHDYGMDMLDEGNEEQWEYVDGDGKPVLFLHGYSNPLPGKPFMHSFDEVI